MDQKIQLKFNGISKIVFAISISIVAMHFLLHKVWLFRMEKSLFYLDEAYTLAALFTSIMSFIVGGLFFIRANSLNGFYKLLNQFAGLLFIFASLDEYFSIHEYLSDRVKEMLEWNGHLGEAISFSWIIPLGLIIVAAIVFLLILILKEKDVYVKSSYFLGLVCFILVMVFEVIGSNLYNTPLYFVSIAFEEGLEMIGLAFFFSGITQVVQIKTIDQTR